MTLLTKGSNIIKKLSGSSYLLEIDKLAEEYDNVIIILDNNIFGYFSYKKLNTLFQFKSRINGLRLWKIFIISKYIESNT